ncbi:hypothetical protein [Kitasatospora sp. NPDC004289]
MDDLRWDDVSDLFDPDLMGALPDVCVAGSSVEDWQAVFDLVVAAGWEWGYEVGGVTAPLPRAAEVLARSLEEDTVRLWVRPVDGVLVNFWPMVAEEIDFDVDLRELQGQQGVDTLCRFLATVGRRLGKAVVMTDEGDRRNALLGYDPVVDAVVVLAEPR